MTQHYKAHYRVALGSYEGNGWIEALPPRRSRAELTELFRRRPAFEPSARSLPYEGRRDLLDQISDFYQPFWQVLDLADAVMSLIQRGYSTRPFPASDAVRGTGPEVVDLDYQRDPLQPPPLIPSLGMLVIGPSGSGKTSAAHAVLGPIPQVIRHGKHKGRSVQQLQVSHIKVTAPGDSSPKSLCKSIFREIDRVAGTNFFRGYVKSRTTEADLIDSLPDVCSSIGLGLLILDELQHLSPRTGGGGEKIMNNLVTLSDTAQLPILYIGTYKAQQLVGREFRHGRRGCTFGASEWHPLRGEDFRDFVRALWRYQYIRKATPEPSEGLLNVIYEQTQGIADVIVKLFMLGQAVAILDGTEELTTGLFVQTAKECLGPVHAILQALRNGDEERLRRVDDVVPIDFAKTIKKVEEGRGVRILVDSASEVESGGRPQTRPPAPLSEDDRFLSPDPELNGAAASARSPEAEVSCAGAEE